MRVLDCLISKRSASCSDSRKQVIEGIRREETEVKKNCRCDGVERNRFKKEQFKKKCREVTQTQAGLLGAAQASAQQTNSKQAKW